MPRPMRMVWGSLVAYWLSGIINPAFVAIAVMIALFIPILISEYWSQDLAYSQPDMDYQPHHSHYPHQAHQPDHSAQKTSNSSTRLLLEEGKKDNKDTK